jgi:hypothetical protein
MPDENYKFHKKRPPNFQNECQAELDYLFEFWESMKPGDYLLKCDFYKTGVKINKDRLVPTGIVVSQTLASSDLSGLYQISSKNIAERRLKEMRTVNPNMMTFHEFVKFLYWENNVKKLKPEEFQELRERITKDHDII